MAPRHPKHASLASLHPESIPPIRRYSSIVCTRLQRKVEGGEGGDFYCAADWSRGVWATCSAAILLDCIVCGLLLRQREEGYYKNPNPFGFGVDTLAYCGGFDSSILSLLCLRRRYFIMAPRWVHNTKLRIYLGSQICSLSMVHAEPPVHRDDDLSLRCCRLLLHAEYEFIWDLAIFRDLIIHEVVKKFGHVDQIFAINSRYSTLAKTKQPLSGLARFLSLLLCVDVCRRLFFIRQIYEGEIGRRERDFTLSGKQFIP